MAELAKIYCDIEELEYNDVDEVLNEEFENRRLTFNNCNIKDLKLWSL